MPPNRDPAYVLTVQARLEAERTEAPELRVFRSDHPEGGHGVQSARCKKDSTALRHAERLMDTDPFALCVCIVDWTWPGALTVARYSPHNRVWKRASVDAPWIEQEAKV